MPEPRDTPALKYFRKTEFFTSAAKFAQCPEDLGAEVAFAGRSNAGKSSAINRLTDNGRLARTSKTPGRTQLINFFRLSDHERLVDLPGYGFARVAEKIKLEWQQELTAYLNGRVCLRGIVLLMDIRHPLQDFDCSFIQWTHDAGKPCLVVLTKSDKFKRGKAKSQLLQVRRYISEMGWSDSVTCQTASSTSGEGFDLLAETLHGWLTVDA